MEEIKLDWTSGEGRGVSRVQAFNQKIEKRTWRRKQLVATMIGVAFPIVFGVGGMGIQELANLPGVSDLSKIILFVSLGLDIAALTLVNFAMIYVVASSSPTSSYDFAKQK